jgi:post-segregation antitoxin (ccd killing protein)
VLEAVRDYDINIPELCITAIMSEIERRNSISATINSATVSREIEIQELKEALRVMREKLERAEEAAAAPRFKLWHK